MGGATKQSDIERCPSHLEIDDDDEEGIDIDHDDDEDNAMHRITDFNSSNNKRVGNKDNEQDDDDYDYDHDERVSSH
jgi:hypothetical protein